MCLAIGAAKKNQLYLTMAKGPDHGDLNAGQVQSDFFLKFAPQCGLRLFVCGDEPAGNAPATARAKDVFEQQHLALLVDDHGSGADDKARMPKASQEKPDSPRGQPKQKCQKIFEHSESLTWRENRKW